MTNLLVICSITPEMRARLDAEFDVVLSSELDDPQAWLLANGASVDYVLTDGHIGVPSEIFDSVPNVKAISSYGVGYDSIDTNLTNARNVPVSHTPSVLDEEVATTALLLYLSVMRNFVQQATHARRGHWESFGGLPLSRSADGRKIGILGLGRIGKAVARKLEAFGAEISYCGRSKQNVPYGFYDDLLAMVQDVEALICVAPGGAATHHLVNAEVLAALGPEGVLINVGRGSVVDENALIAALETEVIGGAGLDVFENEPHIPEALRAHSHVVVTPHIGSATVETRRAMGDLSVDNLIAHKTDGTMVTPVPECAHLFD